MAPVAVRRARNGRSRPNQAAASAAPTMTTTTTHMPISAPMSRFWASVSRPVTACCSRVMLVCRRAAAERMATR